VCLLLVDDNSVTLLVAIIGIMSKRSYKNIYSYMQNGQIMDKQTNCRNKVEVLDLTSPSDLKQQKTDLAIVLAGAKFEILCRVIVKILNMVGFGFTSMPTQSSISTIMHNEMYSDEQLKQHTRK